MRQITIAAMFVGGAIWATAIGSPATAGFLTGNALYSDCTAREVVANARCAAYIVGVHDDFMLERTIEGAPSECTPNGTTAGQLTDVVVRYLRENPETRNLSAALLVRLAIVKGWPTCPHI